MSKKPTKPQKEQSSYELRDIVLAKVRGFPPWPGMIVDPHTVPSSVTKERPGGKKSTFYCVRFFPAGDYAWLVPKDISKLQTHEIEAYINEPYKRSGDLLTGYRIALDPKKWEEERAAAGKDVPEEEPEIDELDSENEDSDGKKQSKSKKRKRDSEAGTTTTKIKVKLRAKKGSAEPTGKKKNANSKGKKSGAKSKAMVESEDEGDHEGAGPSKKSSPPPPKKAKRDKDDEELEAQMLKDPEAVKVRDWRHKLQKSFLSNKSIPKEEDMPALDALLSTVESYDQINIQYLSFSKIGKVMRHVAALPAEKVPRDEEFKFRERAKVLVDKWHQILGSNKPNGTEPAANGDAQAQVVEAQEAVTQATAAIDLNGKPEESSAAVAPAAPAAPGGDVVMTDA